MDYNMDLGAWNAVFAVPSILVDQHLKLAGAVQLKVLLWCLRHAGESCSSEAIAAALGKGRADVEDAMEYWLSAGLLRGNEGAFAPSAQVSAQPVEAAPPVPLPQEQVEPAEPAPQPEEARPMRVLSRPRKADNAFVAKRMEESEEVAFLMQEAQQILGRLINNGESATLLMVHDDFGLPVDVIIMLLQYASAKGKANLRYIEKVAMDWADEEIFTHEKAEEKLRKLADSAASWGQVQRAMGVDKHSPTKAEEAFANLWVSQWGFSTALIREAYERCVNQTGKVNMRYINKILERWHADGVTTLEQAQKEQAARTVKQEKQTTYDIDAFERSGAFDHFNG